MLCGIMVNTSIMLVSTIQEDVKNNRSVGRDPTLKLKNRFNELFSEKNRTHFIQAYRISSTRIRPILMTTLTTIFGMVPMMFDFSEGSQMWRDLSLSVSFGLLASLLINMTLIPLLYYTFTNMQKN
jgi:multidrug efflux pump subunit AcrB